jgi:transcriptional regulator with XRE-family HTH domain
VAVDIKILRCRQRNIVDTMETIHAQTQIETLHTRMRLIRESRHLTLIQAAKLSRGQISAIALGSYERGDRSVSARKLIAIANLYEVPISDLFEAPRESISEERISIDVRKILTTSHPTAQKITEVLRNIARMRGDWNGEVISLRAQDIKSFQAFSGLSAEEITTVITDYGFPRSK